MDLIDIATHVLCEGAKLYADSLPCLSPLGKGVVKGVFELAKREVYNYKKRK